jgi:hypothetical protein
MSIQELLQQAQQLSLQERAQLVKLLVDDIATAQSQSKKDDWQSFIERMYGALADDPIERPPQLPISDREPIE